MLAGGRSTRFGSDKMRAVHRGSPLLHHAIRRLAEVCDDDVVVVLAPGDDPGPLPGSARAIHDPTEGEGPLAGVHAGLLAAARDDLAIVAGGDMPELQVPVLRMMVDRVAADPTVEAVALEEGGRVRPLPMVVRTWPAAERAHALLHAGRRSLRELLASLRTEAIDEATWVALDPGRRTLLDIDLPGDLPSDPAG